ncbi:MAG: HNH endonuclease [Roseiflexaceae bacterium]|nr:HNH endonuclease [Roseiflexaceae bacterium]
MIDPPHTNDELRLRVAKRANERCEYCISPARYAPQRLSVEHVLPRVKGGTNRFENLALDPVNGEQVPLYNPRYERWAEHFAWSADLLLIIGLTPTGRATVAALFLNPSGVVNLRRSSSARARSAHHPAAPFRLPRRQYLPPARRGRLAAAPAARTAPAPAVYRTCGGRSAGR